MSIALLKKFVQMQISFFIILEKNSFTIQQYQYRSSQKMSAIFQIFNAVPSVLKLMTCNSFKCKPKEVLLNKCLYNIDHFFFVLTGNFMYYDCFLIYLGYTVC